MKSFSVLWYKVRSKIIGSVLRHLAYQTNYEIRNTILLLGTTRSGTTYVMESLNEKNDYRLLFEPFNPTYTKEWKTFSARHYVDPDQVAQSEMDVIEKILAGKVHNKWIDRYNQKVKSEQRLVKAVRANILLDYFCHAFPEMAIVFIHRNPYDVVASRLNLGFDPNDVRLILQHDHFIKKHYADVDLDLLRTHLKNPESAHAALWCFENRFVLKGNYKEKISLIRYEDVKRKTISIQNRKVIIREKVRPPSVSTALKKPYVLTVEERNNVTSVLHLFGISDYN